MPDVKSPQLFPAYSGGEPFVFVSYAHRDAHLVFPDLMALHANGVRIWYDEGIDPGNEWPDEIANALTGATAFLVFVSPAAVQSRNVRNEINFALNRNKLFLAVHLQETELPAGLELRMGDIQALMKWRMTEEHYFQKLASCLPASVQTSVAVHRGPLRAGLRYDVAAGDFIEKRELPFVIGVFAELSGHPPAADRDGWIDVHPRNVESLFPPGTAGELRRHGTFRGLQSIVLAAGKRSSVQIKVFDIGAAGLLEGLTSGGSIENSPIFQRSLTDVMKRHGEPPFSLFIGDYRLRGSDEDMALLEAAAKLAFAAQAPFLTSVGPEFFGLEQFSELRQVQSVSKRLAALRPAWNRFRNTEESRFACVALPGFQPLDGEDMQSGPFWSNPAYCLASSLIDSFQTYEWFPQSE